MSPLASGSKRRPSRPIASRQNNSSWRRSEEHTSELQSLRHLVCRLLLEKKKTKKKYNIVTKKKTKIQRSKETQSIRQQQNTTHQKHTNSQNTKHHFSIKNTTVT